MFVFPAHNESYRQRKRAHKACIQCQRRRRRCLFPSGHERCEPCEKANIQCSLNPQYELQEKEVRLDSLAQQSLFSGNPVDMGVQKPTRPNRPSLLRNSSSGLVPLRQQRQAVQAVQAAQAVQSHPRASVSNDFLPLTEGSDISPRVAVPAAPSPPIPSPNSAGSAGTPNSRSSSRDNHLHPRHSKSNSLGSESISNYQAIRSENAPSAFSSINRPLASPSAQPTSPFFSDAQLPDVKPISSSTGSTPVDSESIGMWVKGVAAGHQRLEPHMHTYLSSINAFSMPLRPKRDGIIKLYVESVNSLLHLIDAENFVYLHSIGQAPTLLLHAVLLAGARDVRAREFIPNTREFCAATAAKIRALLFAEVEQDRLTLVRVYALLSLHSEGPDGLENSCSDLQRALHFAISLGIHHERPFIDKEELRNLWWSLLCMDRISAAVNARPLIVNLDDVGVGLPANKPTLVRLVKTCLQLEHVISMYRPSNTSETLPADVDLLFYDPSNTTDPINCTLGLLHLTSVVLAHKRITPESSHLKKNYKDIERMKKAVGVFIMQSDESNRVTESANFNDSEVNAKLLSSASAILKIIRDCKNLPPLPLLPYVVSLTLTVFLRTSTLDDPETGASWKHSCELLYNLSDRWWVAGAMGSMGLNVLKALPQNRNDTGEEPDDAEIKGMTDKQAEDERVRQMIREEELREAEERMQEEEQAKILNDVSDAMIQDDNGDLTEYLDMFSDFPNQTSFLDQAMQSMGDDDIAGISKWFESISSRSNT